MLKRKKTHTDADVLLIYLQISVIPDIFITQIILPTYTAVYSQETVSAYFRSKQILYFAFVEQYRRGLVL